MFCDGSVFRRGSLVVLLLMLLVPCFAQGSQTPAVHFMTYAQTPSHMRAAEALLASIREFAGDWGQSGFYVATPEPDAPGIERLRKQGAKIVPLPADDPALGYFYGIKPLACAAVEALLASEAGSTLIYLDPETLVLRQPNALALDGGQRFACRPVHLNNTIGQAPDAAPDRFWGALYEKAGVDVAALPTIETFVDGVTVRAYYNCIIFSVHPGDGLMRDWLALFRTMLEDGEYQREACADARHRIFLHQAALTAVVSARLDPDTIRILPPDYTYPIGLLDRLPETKKIVRLNDVTTAVLEYLWEKPAWMNTIAIDEPLKSWLAGAYRAYCRLTDRLYRFEGSCNSYYVTTPVGGVVIDPAGAAFAGSPLLPLKDEFPLKAILLTHAHTDHNGGYAAWRGEAKIPLIAQREFGPFMRHHEMLSGFFAARDAIQGNVATIVAAEAEPDIIYADGYEYPLGDLRFRLLHRGGETPDQAVIWIPELKIAFIGDNYYESFPNLAPQRGSKPRWALDYIAALETALALEPEILCPGHGEPVIGAAAVREALTRYRDAIRFVHDATVKGMNEGKDVHTLMREIRLPQECGVGEFYGRASWGVRAIYESYAGWYDGNPVNLYDLPPSAINADLRALIGNDDKVAEWARDLVSEDDPVRALRLCDVVLTENPKHPGVLAARLQALQLLRTRSRNYLEIKQLEHAIARTKAAAGDSTK